MSGSGRQAVEFYFGGLVTDCKNGSMALGWKNWILSAAHKRDRR